MYAAWWRALPGPWPVRLLLTLLALAAVLYACFTWIFPWISGMLPLDDAAVHSAASSGVGSTSTGVSIGRTT